MHHNIQVHELQIEAKGQLLNSFPHNGDVQRLKGVLASEHSKRLLIESGHSNIIAILICLFKLIE